MAEWYVATTGSDTNSGNQYAPFATLQKAANVVSPGDTVWVYPGEYTQPGTAQLTCAVSGTAQSPIRWKALQISARNRYPVKVDGTSANYVWYFTGSYNEIYNFEVTVNDTLTRGGVWFNANYCKAFDCWVHDIPNLSGSSGGGAGITMGVGSIGVEYHRVLAQNIGQSDAATHGLYIAGPDSLMESCIAIGNSGYGLHAYHAITRPKIVHCLSMNNLQGGIVFGTDTGTCSGAEIANNIVVGNYGASGAIRELATCDSSCTVENNIIFSNANGPGLKKSIVTINAVAKNNRRVDPRFLNAEIPYTGTGDYHPRPDSPALAAGIALGVAVDFDGNVRSLTKPSIGPYEYNPAYPVFQDASRRNVLLDLNAWTFTQTWNADFATDDCVCLAFDANITSVTGTPASVTFSIYRVDAFDNAVENLYASANVTGATQIAADIGPGCSINKVLGSRVRFQVAISGGTSPSVVGNFVIQVQKK